MILRGREIGSPVRESCDVVIVGSGSGGAVVARELARAGLEVVLLEEGAHVPKEVYGKLGPTQSLRRLAREAGLNTAIGLGDTPLISLMAGKVVGGSSVLTGGVAYRIPTEVLEDWETRLDLPEVGPKAMEPYFEAIEEAVHVETVPTEMRSRSTELFGIGAAKMGYTMQPLRRNTSGCQGASRCTFGCPHGAKMSVDISMLPIAFAHGARLYSDALVERVDVTGGRARGVSGRFFDQETGEPRVPFEIRARLVVVACGSLHTPLLLRASGLGGPHIGRHMTLHPAFRVAAVFDEEIDGWDGAMQSAFIGDLMHEGLIFNSVYSAPNILAAAFPGVGKDHVRLTNKVRNLAVFGGMVHDDEGGTVRRWFGREPLLTYRMGGRDRERMWKGMALLGRWAFAAGAKEVLLPIFGSEPVTKPKELDELEKHPPKANRVECMSFHPLGTAKMSVDPRHGVVKPTGETWQVENLIVCDGSVVPTSVGVNSQIPIMSVALMLAGKTLDRWGEYARRVA